MLFCDSCVMSLYQDKAIFPTGSMNPDYYFLGDSCYREEIIGAQVFSIANQANQYLLNTMYALDLTMDNSRMFKLVRCDCGYSEENLEKSRNNCYNYAYTDIYKTKPKLIITLGSEVTKFLIKDKFKSITGSRGRIYSVDINGEEFKVMPTFSPNYIVNNPNFSSDFIRDLEHAKSFINGDLVDIDQKELTYALNFNDFKEYYDRKLSQSMLPAYDLETNAHDPRSESARMVGFSLAPDTTSGIYIVRNSLEYKMPDEDWNKIVELTKQYLTSRSVLVHNIMYEGPFTLNEWGVDILDNFEDTLVKARMLRGGDLGSAGLKDQCIKNLGYPDWDTDLDNYRSAFLSLMKLWKPTNGGRPRWDFEFIRTRGLCALYDAYDNLSEDDLVNGVDKNGNPKLTREGKVSNSLNLLRDTIIKYYEDDADYSIIMEVIGDEICNLIEVKYDGPFSYGFIPMKLIRKYGAMDAVGTQDLNVYLEGQMDKLSAELNIDLHKGYYYTKRQFIAGVQMELNGLHWDDEVANKEEQWCLSECYKHLLALIDSPFLDNHLLKNMRWIFDEYLVTNQLDYIMQVLGPLYPQKTGIKLADGTKYKNSEIIDVLSSKLGYDFYEANRELALKVIRQKAHEKTDFMELKSFYNPGSSTAYAKEVINNILITNDIKIANLIAKLNVMIDEEGFDINKYPAGDRKLFQVLIDCKEYNKYVDEFNAKLDDDSNDKDILDNMNEFDADDSDSYSDNEEGEDNDSESTKSKKIKLTDGDTFNKFCEVLPSVQIQSSEMQRLVGESLNYKLESINESSIIDLHKYYVISGVILDDQSTWTDRFWFLIHFRIYKKCSKLRSTYIIGRKVGRGQVYMVDKERLASGEFLTKRGRKYDYTINPGETCLMQGTFAVCFTGDTKVRCLDGNSYSFKELVDSGKDEIWVYSKDENGSVVPAKAKNIRMTCKNAKLVKVILGNGEEIRCTPDHQFMLRDGTYKEAKDLAEGMSLMSLYIEIDNKAYNKVVSVEYLDYTEDVYDLEVPDYHNFALECGIFVHNCSAETLRWRAGLHTLPSDSSIKNIYTSRYKGGSIFAPDFSQMEVRVMSGVSKCTPMIEAFKNGADIHMQNAMKIFKKPAEEVTAAERRHAKMASFMILYGGDYRSFGEEFLGGDIPLAKYIYDSFYEAYPEIKTWIDARHEEMRTTGKVTTLMNTYINISAEKFNGDENKALRAAQNYPIQSSGSYMAGNVLYEVIKFLRDNKMLSKCELFIHDSIEIDIHPKEMLQLALLILPLMNKYPMEEFGIPTTADLVCGVSIGQEVECTDISTNDDYTVGDMTCEGLECDFMAMIENWKQVYEVVEYEILESEQKYESWSQLFISKRCINANYGTMQKKIKARVHVEYGNKINEEYPNYDRDRGAI